MLPGVVIGRGRVVLAGSPCLGEQLRVLPGLIPTSLFCLLYCHGPGVVAAWPCALVWAAVRRCLMVPSLSLCPAV